MMVYHRIQDFRRYQDRYFYNRSQYFGDYPYSVDINIHEAIQPLIAQLTHYDHQRQVLENDGGNLLSLERLTKSLAKQIVIETWYDRIETSLADQKTLRFALGEVHQDLRINVRQLYTHMPVFYICRIRQDHWSEYSLIVEDLYMSPGYPVGDERFMKLMQAGHENYFLRLSPFRDKLKKAIDSSKKATAENTDDMLYEAGRYVLQAAWHEDQMVGFLVADLLNLKEFFQAIELLYLCLSAELCELRGAVNENLQLFFENIYPQQAIRAFLDVLTGLKGDNLNNLPLHAIKMYRRLSLAFSKFLAIEISWGTPRSEIPLWKILYANFSRLKMVSDELNNDKKILLGANKLEKESGKIINGLLEPTKGKLFSV